MGPQSLLPTDIIFIGIVFAVLGSGLYIILGGMIFGLVVSLLFGIKKAYSSGLRLSSASGIIFGLISISSQGWFFGGGEIFSIIFYPILIFIVAVILSTSIGMLGVGLGIFIRYCAGIIGGTYKIGR